MYKPTDNISGFRKDRHIKIWRDRHKKYGETDRHKKYGQTEGKNQWKDNVDSSIKRQKTI